MAFLGRKQHSAKLYTGMKRLALVLFIVSISSAFIDTIWAVYLDGFFHQDYLVGFFSGFLSMITFVSLFAMVPLIQKTHKSSLFSLTLFSFAVLYIILAVNTNLIVFIFVSIILTILISLKLTTFGIIVKNQSKKNNLVGNEGLMYTFANFAWVIGPLTVGIISLKFGLSSIFFIAATFSLLALIFFETLRIKEPSIPNKRDKRIVKNFFGFFKDKNRTLSYLLGTGVSYWWALIYLYVPLYMIHQGLNSQSIGFFIFAIAVPLISLEYFFSKISGKYGIKNFFQTGYLILIVVSAMCFFFSENTLAVLIMLVLASVGVAMLEPTTEAYFFDVIKNKKNETKFYGPYNTAVETGLMLGKFLPAILLIFLPFRYVFLLFSISMIFFFIIATLSKNIIEERNH